MLVLSRKQQQQIKIGDQITVTIVKVKGNTVRVGIEAPRDVRVIRAELPKEASDAEIAPAQGVFSVDASEFALETELNIDHAEETATEQVISFRVRCEAENETPSVPAANRSAAHLPLKRIHNRFGSAPLKQLLASCATLAK
jgi:carbon storage regulator